MQSEKLQYIKVCKQKVYGYIIEQLKIDGGSVKYFVSYNGKTYKLTRRKVYTEEKS